MFSEFDRLAMTRALALAERGMHTTHPNPRVGCVIARDDRIIAEGWHERAGQAHAEVAALNAAKEPVAGATAYVTLEPCSHHGRTPPCVNALIEAKPARVVFAVQDPNPQVSGRGADTLLRAGIAVEAGLMAAEATELNIGFMKRMREGLPWVRVKLAMSLDGRTALSNGASQWITSEHSRNDVQRWRARSSAIMTGVGTLIADDPQLNVRIPGFNGTQPLRVVLDARLISPPGARLLAPGGGEVLVFAATAEAGAARTEAGGDPSTVTDNMAQLVSEFEGSAAAVLADPATAVEPATAGTAQRPLSASSVPPMVNPSKRAGRTDTATALQSRRAALLKAGASIEEVAAEAGYLDMFSILTRLGELQVNEVLVESGATLAGQLLTTFFVDELLLYIAPKILGPQGQPLMNVPELQSLQDALGFSLFDAKRFGDDLRLRLRPK